MVLFKAKLANVLLKFMHARKCANHDSIVSFPDGGYSVERSIPWACHVVQTTCPLVISRGKSQLLHQTGDRDYDGGCKGVERWVTESLGRASRKGRKLNSLVLNPVTPDSG